jgi:DNA-binding transcriptional regulator YiaG
MTTVSSTDVCASAQNGAPNITVLVEGLFSFVVKGARRVVQLSDQDLVTLKRLMVAFANAKETARGEIMETIFELVLPEDMIGDVAASEPKGGKANEAAPSHVFVGGEIRKRRKKLGLSQKELAERVGIPQTHVSRLETGKHAPTHVTVERLAKALKTAPHKLDSGYPDTP